MREVDVLVLGQGVAGTLVSWHLRQAGASHVVVDRGHRRAASRAAAGIVNPVTGRRFVLTWRAAAAIEGLSVYRDLEAALGARFVRPLEILRDLRSAEALNQWDMRRADPAYATYMRPPELRHVPGLAEAQRIGPTRGYRVDLPSLLSAFRQNLLARGELAEASVHLDGAPRGAGYGLRRGPDRWALQRPALPGESGRRASDLTAAAVIDCRGAGAMADGWSDLPWRGTKGEALRFAAPSVNRDVAVKRGLFACPIGEAQDVWIGGTNVDRELDDAPSRAGAEALRTQAAAYGLTVPAGAEHLAAVRPTTRHRRPFAQPHADQDSLWLCGGLGTKGASLAPLLAREVVSAVAAALGRR